MWEQKAYEAWNILTRNPEPITYGDLGVEIDVHHRNVRHPLSLIQNYCTDENLPPLTMLVYNKNTGEPGNGFIERGYTLENVCGFNWNGHENPFEYANNGNTRTEIIRAILDAIKEGNSVADTLQHIEPRIKQVMFRNALLKIYDGQCAFCGLTFEDALEACHIVPYHQSNPEQKVNPQNGILLCATHHKLFDKDYFSVTEIFKIKYSGNKSECVRKSDKAIVSMDGKSIKYSKKYSDCLPSVGNIKQRNDGND